MILGWVGRITVKGRFWCGFTPQLMCISIIFIIIYILFRIDKTNNKH